LVSQNPNTREPKKKFFVEGKRNLAFAGATFSPSLVFFFSSLSPPLLVARDHLPWSSYFLFFLTSPLFFGDIPALADSTASTYVPLYVARRKNNPSLSRLERLVGRKKNSTANLIVSFSVLDFSLSCDKRLEGKKFFDGEFS
jgi:hypothetical protein